MNSLIVLVYSPYWSTLGGGEKYVASFASALASIPFVKVTLLTTDETTTKEKMEQYFGISLLNVGFEYVSGGFNDVTYRSAHADLFVYISNFQHIHSQARKTVLLLQIPYSKITPLSVAKKIMGGELREGIKDIARHRLISVAQSDFDLTVVNSHFVHDTLLRNFGLPSVILYPPISDFLLEKVRKKNIILSVGRFFRGLYNDKRYDVLTKAFRSLSRSELKGWEYHIVGSSSNDVAASLVKELRRENDGFPVFFHVNETHETLKKLYNEAQVLWHAAGFGSDEERYPERMEHFGMTTAEAMSAGCIPIVINKGGQKEIVEHGVSGFLWNTPDELAGQTVKVLNDRSFAARIRRHARERASRFSAKRFQKEAVRIFSPLLKAKKR